MSLLLALGGGAAYTLTVDAGVFAITGQNTTLTVGYRLVAGVGTIQITGQNAALLAGHSLSAGVGTIVVTGINASLREGHGVFVAQGVFAVTGVDVTFRVGHVLTPSAGAFVWTGTAADLIYTPVGSVTLTADPGVFGLTGQPVTLIYLPTIVMADAVAPLRRPRQAPRALRDYCLALAPGRFRWQGQPATLRVQRLVQTWADRQPAELASAPLRVHRLVKVTEGRSLVTGSADLTRGGRLSAQSVEIAVMATGARFTIDGSDESAWRQRRAVPPPDPIDTAWTDLQRQQAEDEDALLLLGMFDR